MTKFQERGQTQSNAPPPQKKEKQEIEGQKKERKNLLLIHFVVHARNHNTVCPINLVAMDSTHPTAVRASKERNKLIREPRAGLQAIMAKDVGVALLAQVSAVQLHGGPFATELDGNAKHDAVDAPDGVVGRWEADDVLAIWSGGRGGGGWRDGGAAAATTNRTTLALLVLTFIGVFFFFFFFSGSAPIDAFILFVQTLRTTTDVLGEMKPLILEKKLEKDGHHGSAALVRGGDLEIAPFEIIEEFTDAAEPFVGLDGRRGDFAEFLALLSIGLDCLGADVKDPFLAGVNVFGDAGDDDVLCEIAGAAVVVVVVCMGSGITVDVTVAGTSRVG